MVPMRDHLSVATSALVLVVPVVVGVAVGGFAAGVVAVAAGFLAYDLVFIPPYGTLSVGEAQNWVALGVYVVVMVLVARVVSRLDQARDAARRSAADARRVFSMSDLLVQDRSVDDLLRSVVSTVREAFGLESAALLLPSPEGLQVRAWAGQAFEPSDLAGLDRASGAPVHLRGSGSSPIQTLALSASDRPVGILLLRGAGGATAVDDLLRTFANHAATAVERAQLREQAVRAGLLEEVDRLRQALIGAVSHDLRTPLATIKVSATSLLDAGASMSEDDRHELLSLMDHQADRLTRLVNNLLDMTRIQAGVLELRLLPWDVSDLLGEAAAALRPLVGDAALRTRVPRGLPLVEADQVLIGQVLANLVDNAARHTPEGSRITLGARDHDHDRVQIYVDDQGPGVPPQEREAVFDSFVGFDTGKRAGLGLAIAKAFVEAHGQPIWVEPAPGGGARFAFTLPALGGGARAA